MISLVWESTAGNARDRFVSSTLYDGPNSPRFFGTLSSLLGVGFESGQNAGLIRTLEFTAEFGRNTFLHLDGFKQFLWVFDPQAIRFLDFDDQGVGCQHLAVNGMQSVEVVAENDEFTGEFLSRF